VASSPTEPVARTRAGELAGRQLTGVAAFRGIPYAAPPVGPARWRPAAPVEPWAGRRPADRPGPAPLQSPPRRNTLLYQANFADRDALVMSEDCLYLNVWTPAVDPAARLPVMVWLPGGGNRFGSGSQDLYDGHRLAQQGVVVVAVTHRLGALGFLAHPGLAAESPDGSTGNYALTDILAALTWVRDEIAGFGGDPGNVTAFGCSAGAANLCHLMASPLATGLFSRVIGQSLSAFTPDRSQRGQQDAERDGEQLATALGASTVQDLRNLSGVELLRPGNFGPIVDHRVLPRATVAVFEAGEQLAVPLLVGHNADEGSPYAPRHTAESFLAAAPADPDLREQYLRCYPAATDEQAHLAARRSTSDTMFDWRIWKWATTHHRTSGAPTWMYHFTQRPPAPEPPQAKPATDGAPGYGSFHTAELPYVWDNLDARDWPWTDGDRQLAAAMSAAWVRFATTGTANAPELPWPIFGSGPDGPVRYFGDNTTQLGTVPHLDAMLLHDRLAQPVRV
jgi:para-nitrobenzyl esterase